MPLMIGRENAHRKCCPWPRTAGAVVYCLSHDDGYDLRVLDLTVDPPGDVAITNDGKSCSPGF